MKDTKKINPKIFKRCSKILKIDDSLEKKSNVDTYLHVQPKEASSVGVFRMELLQLTVLKACFADGCTLKLERSQRSPVGHGLANVRSSIYVLYGIIIY